MLSYNFKVCVRCTMYCTSRTVQVAVLNYWLIFICGGIGYSLMVQSSNSKSMYFKWNLQGKKAHQNQSTSQNEVWKIIHLCFIGFEMEPNSTWPVLMGRISLGKMLWPKHRFRLHVCVHCDFELGLLRDLYENESRSRHTLRSWTTVVWNINYYPDRTWQWGVMVRTYNLVMCELWPWPCRHDHGSRSWHTCVIDNNCVILVKYPDPIWQ